MRALSVVLATLITSSSCAVQRVIAPPAISADAPARKPHRFTGAPGQDVTGYTTTDGRWHSFDGSAWVDGDSMVFDRPANERERMMPVQPAVRFRVALADLASVKTHEISPVRTVLSLAALVFLTWGLAIASAMKNW